MKWRDVIDIRPRGTGAAPDLGCEELYVRVLSDFDEAPVGVAAVTLPLRDHAPVLEKHLRDTGITETVSTVITHGIRRSGELARVFYTAVPIASHLRRQRWGVKGKHVFVFPVAALLARAATDAPGLSSAVLIKSGAALVIVAREREVRVAEWFALGGSADDDAVRLAEIVRRDLIAEADETSTSEDAVPVNIYHVDAEASFGDGAESTARALSRVLSGMSSPQHLGGVVVTISRAASLLADAKLTDSVQRPLDRLAYYAERCVPVAAFVMVALTASGLFGALQSAAELERQQQAYQETQQRIGSGDQQEIARLSALEIERTQGTARLQELLMLREKAARLPDLRRILQDIRTAVPERVKISEVGVASGEENAVIFVNGSMQWSGEVLADEHRLVAALQQKGYVVKQRDFFSASASSGFRLALTWGLK